MRISSGYVDHNAIKRQANDNGRGAPLMPRINDMRTNEEKEQIRLENDAVRFNSRKQVMTISMPKIPVKQI